MGFSIGDIVTINILDENWDWGYRPFKNQKGTKGIFKGYSEIFYGRTQSFGKKPGVYENKCWIKVEAEGKIEYLSHCHIDGAKYEDGNFLRELPETPFWEDDIVRDIKTKKEFKVVRIEYKVNYEIANTGIACNLNIFVLSDDFGSGWEQGYRENELELVSRGKIWKYYHNEPIEFSDIKEEGNFYKRIGECEDVRNPATNNYVWTLEEVLQAIKDGIVDAFYMSSGIFGTKSRICAIKLKNEDVGNRLRKFTLENWNKDE